MKTKLQLALDDISLGDALALVEKVQKRIDIVEIGTPFLMEYGMEAVRRFRRQFPDKEILCDGKIADAGGYEAELAYQAGADYATVLAVTDECTIADVVLTAKRMGKKVMADMLCVQNLGERAKRLEELGVDVIAVHTGVDQQAMGRTPLDDLRELRAAVKHAGIAVAGGVKAENVEEYLACGPEIIIVGGGIVHAREPEKEAGILAEKLKKQEAAERNA